MAININNGFRTSEVHERENCVNCKNFRSYQEEYDFDPLEPSDYGICLHEDMEERGEAYGIATVCDLFEKN